MVAQAHTHGTSDDIGLAVMGVRGLHNLGKIIEDDEESGYADSDTYDCVQMQ